MLETHADSDGSYIFFLATLSTYTALYDDTCAYDTLQSVSIYMCSYTMQDGLLIAITVLFRASTHGHSQLDHQKLVLEWFNYPFLDVKLAARRCPIDLEKSTLSLCPCSVKAIPKGVKVVSS